MNAKQWYQRRYCGALQSPRVPLPCEPQVVATKLRPLRHRSPPKPILLRLLSNQNKTKLTVCGQVDGLDLESGHVLIFPDMLRYRFDISNPKVNVNKFVLDVLINKHNAYEWDAHKRNWVDGSYVFVCVHGDKPNELCGQDIFDVFTESLSLNKLMDDVFAIPCSDIGDPELAGNIIIFSKDDNGNVDGYWYGLVSSLSIYDIAFLHIAVGDVCYEHYRGSMANRQFDWWRSSLSEKHIEIFRNWDSSADPNIDTITKLMADHGITQESSSY